MPFEPGHGVSGGSAGDYWAQRRVRQPETRYAKSGELFIAYQVVGEGRLDLVYAPGTRRTWSSTGNGRRPLGSSIDSPRSPGCFCSTAGVPGCLIPRPCPPRWRRPWTTFERSWTPGLRARQQFKLRLGKVLRLSGVSYEPAEGGGQAIGLIGEDVGQVMP
jgi:hypothetical protein